MYQPENHPRLGVCYYPEHWPEDTWEDDAARMKALGLSTVRIAEFAWAKMEPEPGVFTWGWLDRAVETLGNAGLKVVLCTPTPTPPKWLTDAYPSTLRHSEDGLPEKHGSRRHCSVASKTYREQSRRISHALADRYGQNPHVIGWQTDNEYACHDSTLSYGPEDREAFQLWLGKVYGDINALNAQWGTVFWSMTYRSFDEVELPNRLTADAAPAHWLDFRRFFSDMTAEFNREQCDILRAGSREDMFITHNFMVAEMGFDHWDVSSDLDFASWDSYPLGFLEKFAGRLGIGGDAMIDRYMRIGHPDIVAMHHDMYRDMSRTGRLWVMEQQPGPVNWAKWNPAPVDGAVRFWTLEAVAHGAEVVSYFRWRQAQWAQETYHTGLNRPDGTPDRASLEIETLRDELPKLTFGDINDASGGDTANTVGLYFDWDAAFTYEALQQGADQNAFATMFGWYHFLRRMGLNVEFISPSQMSVLPAYIIPAAPVLDADMVDFIRETGAPAIFCSRSGSRDGTLNWLPQPMVCEDGIAVDPLMEDLFLDRTETLRPTQKIGVDLDGNAVQATSWVEHLRVMGLSEPGSNEPPVEVIAQFTPGPFEPSGLDAAIVRQGNIHYLAFEPDYAGMKAIMEPIFDAAMIAADELPEDIRIRRSDGRLYVMNFGQVAYDSAALGLRGEAIIGDGTVVQPYTVSVFAD